MNRIWLAGLTALLLHACAAEPESQSGSCALSCSQPKIGASTFKIKPLGNPSVDMSCVSDFKDAAGAPVNIAPLNGPVEVSFLIYEDTEGAFPTDPAPSTKPAGGASGLQGGIAAPGDAPLVSPEPRAGVAFEPALRGILDVGKTNAEFKKDATTVTSFKFAGVVTPSSEWCSDSCGVISYQFWPDCQKGGTNAVQAGVRSGAATLEAAYNFLFTAVQ